MTSAKIKIGRNDRCFCGSGKKNKDCCKHDHITEEVFLKAVHDAGMASLNNDEANLLKSIADLEGFLAFPGITRMIRINILLSLAAAYQRRGRHHDALALVVQLKELIPQKERTQDHLIRLEAMSLAALQQFDEAAELIEEVRPKWLAAPDNKEGAAFNLLEAGKTYLLAKRIPEAKACLEKCVELIKDHPKEIETFNRAKANLANIMLWDDDEKVSARGLKLLEASLERKAGIGDLIGVSTDYSNLARYYLAKNNYRSALAYYRKDLWLSRKIGDLHAIDISLRSLANVYIIMRQYKEAKKLIHESARIGEQIQDPLIAEMADYHLKVVKRLTRESAAQQQAYGPAADCQCSSDKTYEDCCGIADHDPVELPFRIPGNAEFIENEAYRFARRPEEINRLDFIFRDSPDSQRRYAWMTYEFKQGWVELYELPDMANTYLLSAKGILNQIPEDYGFTDTPLSCLIMAVSALEAFINQVSYFLYETRKSHQRFNVGLSPEFNLSVVDFQRNLELTMKWELLGTAICKANWQPSRALWNDFRNLVYIRNEFIHFKLEDYERVIPAPKPHPIFKKVPKTVKLREVYHSWPTKLLTPSFADWCVTTAEAMIRYFKNQYIAQENTYAQQK
jgi:tetratricopeptide (TPR) repeat protein